MKTNPPRCEAVIGPLYLFAVLAIGLLLSASAYSDTYNFFFEPKKKTTASDDPTPESPQPPQSAVTPPPIQNSSTPEKQSQTITSPPGTAPIVINNTVSVPNTIQMAPTPAPAPVAQTPAPKVEPAPAQNPSLFNQSEERKKELYAHLGLSLFTIGQGEELKKSSWGLGLALSLGYRFTPWLGIVSYAGSYSFTPLDGSSGNTHYLVGLDLDIVPFRLNVGSVDALEIGLLVGATTLPGSLNIERVATIHFGLRTNINLSKRFGLTSSIRATGGYAIVEGGFAAQI